MIRMGLKSLLKLHSFSQNTNHLPEIEKYGQKAAQSLTGQNKERIQLLVDSINQLNISEMIEFIKLQQETVIIQNKMIKQQIGVQQKGKKQIEEYVKKQSQKIPPPK